MQFWSYHSILMYQVATSVKWKHLLGLKMRSKGQRWGSPDDQIWAKMQFWNHHSYFYVPSSNIWSNKNIYRGISENLRFIGQRSRSLDDQIWTKMEPDAHYRAGFWRPMCNLGILSQPSGRGIPLMLQRQKLPYLLIYRSHLCIIRTPINALK